MSECSFVAGIDSHVIAQIKAREDKFGKSPKTDEELMVIHGNCPWVVLRSGVDAPSNDADRRKVFPRTGTERPYVTNDWAKKSVLGGELQNRSGDRGKVRPQGIQTQPGRGINPPQTLLDSAYRITEYQGHRPVAGITEFTVTTKDTWGMVFEVSIKIKCWSRDELDLLDRVYFKPGYTALLEWGHTLYFREDKSICKTPSMMISDERFFAGGDYRDLDADILKKRREDSNREAMFGYITNFSFSLNKDGSYDCTVKMLSKGSVIKGLRIKGTSQSGGNESNVKEDELSYEDISEWHKIHQAFIWFEQQGKFEKNIEELNPEDDSKNYRILPPRRGTGSHGSVKKVTWFNGKEALEAASYEVLENGEIKNPSAKDLFESRILEGLESFPVIAVPLRTASTASTLLGFWSKSRRERHQQKEFYITLRTLLRLINQFNSEDRFYFNLWDDSSYVDPDGTKDIPTPSLNPYIAVKPVQGRDRDYSVELDGANHFESLILELDPRNEGGKGGRKIQNIWINFDLFVSEIGQQLEAKVEDYSIFDALQSLLGRVQKAFGNINEFKIVTDHRHSDSYFTIIDSKCIVTDPAKIPEIQVTGLNNTISNLTVQSEVSSDLANQMSIAAQAPRTYQDGSETADEAMIHWGENCENRWWLPAECREKSDGDNSSKKPYENTKKKWLKKLKKNYNSVRKGNNIGLDGNSKQPLQSQINEQVYAIEEERFRDVQLNGETYFHELVATEAATKKGPNLQMGIIPIRAGLTMMGIGNLTIGNVFRIKSAVLLPKYQNWAHIITGIEHRVTRAGWITVLKTQYYPIDYGDISENIKTTGYSKDMQSGVNSNIESGKSTNYQAIQNACGMLEAFKATDYTFPTPEGHGCCARYTYSWARAFTKGKDSLTLPADKTTSLAKNHGIAAPPGINGGGVGHANQTDYENNLRSLGYQEQEIKSGMSPAQITQYANSNCSTGDILIYYPVDSNGKAYSNGPYGHTQFYTGTQWVSDYTQSTGYSNSKYAQNNFPTNYKLIHLKAPQRHSDWDCSV